LLGKTVQRAERGCEKQGNDEADDCVEGSSSETAGSHGASNLGGPSLRASKLHNSKGRGQRDLDLSWRGLHRGFRLDGCAHGEGLSQPWIGRIGAGTRSLEGFLAQQSLYRSTVLD
jgi:hypothetical protein